MSAPHPAEPRHTKCFTGSQAQPGDAGTLQPGSVTFVCAGHLAGLAHAVEASHRSCSHFALQGGSPVRLRGFFRRQLGAVAKPSSDNRRPQ